MNPGKNSVSSSLLKRYSFDLLFWFIAFTMYLVSALSSMDPIDLRLAILAVVLMVIPPMIPVYLNNYLLNSYLLKKNRIPFLLISPLQFVLFSYLFKQLVEKYIYPEADFNYLLLNAQFILMYTGIKYLKAGFQNRQLLLEEENKRIQAEKEVHLLRSLQSQVELHTLQSQISPHFLFNALNSIYGLSLHHPARVSEAILKLSELFRYITDNLDKKRVLLKNEITFLESYLDLARLKHEDNCSISYRKEATDIENMTLAPFLLIILVENSFKHGIGADASKNFVDIALTVSGKELVFQLKNHLPDLKKDENEGKGLENLRQRLSILYPELHMLNIEADENTFSARLMIKLT